MNKLERLQEATQKALLENSMKKTNLNETYKEGTRVKIKAPGNQYHNGKTGIITYIDDEVISVKLDNNQGVVSNKTFNYNHDQIEELNENHNRK